MSLIDENVLNKANVVNDDLPDGDENLFGDDEENVGAENDAADGEETDPNGIKVETKKRVVRNPRPRLTVETLSGPRGIQTIEDYYKDTKFRGRGYEKQDLDEIMRRLQHWGHRMYPTYTFDDILNNIERLSKKKPLQTHMSRYRLGMLESLKESEAINEVDEAGVDRAGQIEDEPYDEFDALLGEQIAMSRLAPRTPAHRSTSGDSEYAFASNATLGTPFNRGNNAVVSTPNPNTGNLDETSDLAQPLPSSQPVTPTQFPHQNKLSAEQMARIAENRRKAQLLRAKRLDQQ